MYVEAVEGAFGMDVDYAMLDKAYMAPIRSIQVQPRRVHRYAVSSTARQSDPKHISTSFVERQNLTMRMSMRRFTRLTNAHSKKLENHEAAIALHYMHYNYCRIHSTSVGSHPRWKRVWRIMCVYRGACRAAKGVTHLDSQQVACVSHAKALK